MPKFGIWATVTGGVTGSRAAWLKRDDERVEFETRAEAEQEADRLNNEMNNTYSRAYFRYYAKELD
jgi:hypothetical protein